MTCVSRRRRWFTLATVVFATIAGCAGQTTRVRWRSVNPATEPARNEGSPDAVSVPTAATDGSAPGLPPGRLSLRAVADTQLTTPWAIRFASGCFTAMSNAQGAPRVEVVGDWVVAGYDLRLKLDASLSRVIPGRQIERSALAVDQLADAWTGVRPGTHRLAVFAARQQDGQIPLDDASHFAVTLCDFVVHSDGQWEAVEGKAVEGKAELTLLGPEGTFHGSGRAPLVQLVLARSPAAPQAVDLNGERRRLVVARPDGGQEIHVIGRGVYELLPVEAAAGNEGSLPAGDYALWLDRALEPTRGAPHGVAQPPPEPAVKHVITVNPE